MRSRHILLTGVVLVLSAWAAVSNAAKPATSARMRGICWEAAHRIEAASISPLRDLGVDWISQTPFGWARSLTATEIRYDGTRGLWGETDDGLVTTAAMAKALGIKTLLKPHLWVRHGEWQGDIAMATDDAWRQWFASYESFILHYAKLAQANEFEALAVGTELGKTTARTAEWRRIIARVREVYHGKLTYCANWNDEAERVGFWDDLDFIGVQAYYPLATVDRPSKRQLEAAWTPIAKKLASLAKRTGKSIVFTEVGFKSHEGSLKQPWQWETEGAVALDLQRDAYAAMFETFWTKPWFAGVFVWKWHPSPRSSDRAERDFTPQGKPALLVIKTYYTAPR
jgi:hypothetical protein